MGNLDGISWYGNRTIEDQVLHNVITYLKYGLLEIGAYYNINKDQINYRGANESVLQPVTFYGSGGIQPYSVYKGVKHDWIWESGVTLRYSGGTSPINISGIFVNDVFYPTGTTISGTGYTIDYSRGQTVFHQPLNSGHTVKCAYSIRMAHVYPEDSAEYRSLTTDWISSSNSSGVYSSRELAYLPAIVVGVDGWRSKPVHLGNREKYCQLRLQFNILSNNAHEARKLSDIIYFLEDKTIQLYDLNSSPLPLNISGSIKSDTKTWPQLVSGYFFNFGKFLSDCVMNKINSTLPVHQRRLFITFEIPINPEYP
jgi:hypothetical protein